MEGIGGIHEKGDARHLRHELPEELEPFPLQIRRNRRQSCEVSPGPGEARNELGKALVLALRPAILDDNVPAFDVAEVTQPLAKRPDEIGLEGSRGVPEKSYPVHLPRLRPGGTRRGEEAARQSAEKYPSGGHWVTFGSGAKPPDLSLRGRGGQGTPIRPRS